MMLCFIVFWLPSTLVGRGKWPAFGGKMTLKKRFPENRTIIVKFGVMKHALCVLCRIFLDVTTYTCWGSGVFFGHPPPGVGWLGAWSSRRNVQNLKKCFFQKMYEAFEKFILKMTFLDSLVNSTYGNFFQTQTNPEISRDNMRVWRSDP